MRLVTAAARFIALSAVALALGETFAHVREAGPKAALASGQYLVVQLHLYQNFGPTASVLEPLAMIASVTLAVLVRRRPIPFWTAVLATACVAGMLIAFAIGNAPINQEQAGWTRCNLPSDWRQVRDAWEHFHAASFGLAALAFAALLVETLYDGTSAGPAVEQPRRRPVDGEVVSRRILRGLHHVYERAA